MSKKNKYKANSSNRPAPSANASGSTQQSPQTKQTNADVSSMPENSHVISREEYKLFQALKKVLDENGNPDMTAYRINREKEVEDELAITKMLREEEIESYLKKKETEYKDQLNQDNAQLKGEISELKARKKELESEIKKSEDDNKAIQDKQLRIIEEANKKAEKIIEKAEKDSEKANEAYEKRVALRESELNKRGEAIEGRVVDLDARENILKMREVRLARKEEIYMSANPDKVESLEREIEQKKAYIEELRADYLSLQKSIDEAETIRIKANGRSIEDLIKENEQLLQSIDKLENRCNRYTDFELNEMKRALEMQPELQREIEEKNSEVLERTSELKRLKGNIMELEQMKAQMDLIRTLNDHLKQELETSKRALESRVGEVCPALTEVDIEETDEKGTSRSNYEQRKQILSGYTMDKTLFEIVQHVKRYAASQSEPLYYEEKDLRAFIAGLAASRLTILQGLSGTGKTSLPKVFTDAIFGEMRIVPVESSWRDRNELLGYYNDFNRKFTAKEFTCHLYRAGMPNYKDTLFFIILDEMNLSRVEYYFADFLSIMEDKKSKWEIKLVDVDLRSLPSELPEEVIAFNGKDGNERAKELCSRFYDHNELIDGIVDQKEKLELISYLSKYAAKSNELHSRLLGGPQKLINGNTIRIPLNVWFIGTANRDESTFEISDKVYDRAQVLNFSRRAKGSRLKDPVSKMYVSYSMLERLFDAAVNTNRFDSSTDPLVERIDRQLRDKFKITFGNRISTQMDRFVPVYMEAGKGSAGLKEEDLKREAIDYQLTNKVLRKLEYKQLSKENLDDLKKLFEDEYLLMGAEFIEWKKQNEG